MRLLNRFKISFVLISSIILFALNLAPILINAQDDTIRSRIAKIYPISKTNKRVLEAVYLTGEKIGTLKLQYYNLNYPYPIDSYELKNKEGIIYQKYDHQKTVFTNFDKNGILESKLKFDTEKNEYLDSEYYTNGTLFKIRKGNIKEDFPNGHLSYLKSTDTNRPLFFYLRLSSGNDTTTYFYPNGNPLKSQYSNKSTYYLEDGSLDTSTYDIPSTYSKTSKTFSKAKKSGTFITYAKTGEFKEIEQYKNNKRHGIRKIWNPENGVLLVNETYKDDNLVGSFENYYLNGSPMFIGEVAKNNHLTIGVSYHKNGKVEIIHSALKTQFDNDGNIIIEGVHIPSSINSFNYNQVIDSSIVYEGEYKDGFREGLWIAKNSVSGRVIYKGHFKKGFEVGKWKFSLIEHGFEKQLEINFNNLHQFDGSFKFSYKGEFTLNGEFENGKKVGLWQENYNGKPYRIHQFSKDSILSGTIKEMYRNGKIKMERFILNDSIFRLDYLEDGTLSSKGYKAITDSNFIYESYRTHNGESTMTKQIKLGEAGKYLVFYYNGSGDLLSKYEKSDKYRLDGTYTTYYENGNIKEEGFFSKGERKGTFKYYNEVGELTETINFVNGKRSFDPIENEICYCIDTLSDNTGGFTPSLGNQIPPKKATGHTRLFQIDTSLFNTKLFYKGAGRSHMTIIAFEDVKLKVSDNISVNLTGCRKGSNPASFNFSYQYYHTGIFSKINKTAYLNSRFVSIQIPKNAIFNQRTDTYSLTKISLKEVSLKYQSNNKKSKESLLIKASEVCPDSIYISTTELRAKLKNEIVIESRSRLNLSRNNKGTVRFEGSFTFKSNSKIKGNIAFSVTENNQKGIIKINRDSTASKIIFEELKSNQLNPKYSKKIETYRKYKKLKNSEDKVFLKALSEVLNLVQAVKPETSLKSRIFKQLAMYTYHLKTFGLRTKKRYYKLLNGNTKQKTVTDYSTIKFKTHL